MCLKLASNASEESMESSKLRAIKVLDELETYPFLNDDLKIQAFTKVLPDIALLSYASLTKNDYSDLNKTLVKKICSVIFNFKTKPYEGLLHLFDESNETAVPSSDFVYFFEQLQDLIQKQEYISKDVYSDIACAAFLKNILHEVLSQNKSGSEPFKVLALLCALSGVDIPLLVTANSSCKNILKVVGPNNVLNITVLSSLLEACADYPQCFNDHSAPEGHLTPSVWFDGIAAVLMDAKLTKNKCSLLKCFRYLTKISVTCVENNITSVIKLCLLSINVHSQDSKKEYSSLFKDLISLFSKLHKLPKFFVKLLLALTECIQENSVGKCVLKGQVYPDVLESLASHIQELPFGQKLELWKIFSETYSTFVNMSQLFDAGKGATLFIAQLFSTFLLNSRIFQGTIPDNAFSKFVDLIEHTTTEIKNNSYVLTNLNEAQLPQKSFLLLCYSLGEIEMRSISDERYPHKSHILKSVGKPLDCSLLLNFLDDGHIEIFESFLKWEDKALGFLVYLLLFQKVRGLIHKGKLSDEEKTHLKASISALLNHAIDSVHSNNSWDLDLCSLNENNYGSAVWRVLLKCLPLILDFTEFKELILLCSCFRHIVMHESLSDDSSGKDLKSIVLRGIQNPCFHTSLVFQSAFTASLWKLDPACLVRKRSFDEIKSENSYSSVLLGLSVYKTKWIKYAESTPKDALNSMWENLKHACDLLNQNLSSDANFKLKLKLEVYSVVKLIECLDVEYLFPGNQLRCLIGLSVLFFLSPESFKPKEGLKMMEQISKQIVASLEGIRSIWLFDFVSSGDYLQQVVSSIERIMEKNPGECILDWCKVLLRSLINLVTLNVHNLSSAVNFFSQGFCEKQVSLPVVLTLSFMLEKLSGILRRKVLNPEFKEVCEKLSASLSSCCVTFLKKYEGDHNNYIFTILVESYTEVIGISTIPSPLMNEKMKSKFLAQLPKFLKVSRESIWNQEVNRQVYLNLFSKVLKHLSDFQNLVPDGFHIDIWDSVKLQLKKSSNTPQNEGSEIQLFNSESDIEFLQSVFSLFSKEKINEIFHEILLELKDHDADHLATINFKTCLTVLQQVIESDNKRAEAFISPATFQNLMNNLHEIVLQTDMTELHLKKIKIPVLEFINFLIKLKKGKISRPCVILSLHFCKCVQLLDMITDLPNYVLAFQAVWNVVYDLLGHHVAVVASASSPFFNVTTKLLKSIVLAGSHDAMSASNDETKALMLICARDIDRLFTMISNHERDFAKLVPELIVTYVDSVQHITLESNIKTHLLSGLNRLFDICSEDSLKLIAVNISHSCRDIYTNIVKNYRQYRYRGGA